MLAAIVAVVIAVAAVVSVLVLAGGDDQHLVGDEWSRVPHVESVFGVDQTEVLARALAENDGTIVAVGNDGVFGGRRPVMSRQQH